jgi:hypothetical protein
MMTPVWPVIPKEGPVAKFVKGDNQAIAWDSTVDDPVVSPDTCLCFWDIEGNKVVLVLETQLQAIFADLLHLHAFFINTRAGKIQLKLLHLLPESNLDIGRTPDHIAGIIQVNLKAVSEDIDVFVPLVVILAGSMPIRKKQQEQKYCSFQALFLHLLSKSPAIYKYSLHPVFYEVAV